MQNISVAQANTAQLRPDSGRCSHQARHVLLSVYPEASAAAFWVSKNWEIES